MADYFKGKITAEEATNRMASEWAALKTSTGEGVYDKIGTNSATVSSITIITSLEETKKMVDDAGGYDKLFEEFENKKENR